MYQEPLGFATPLPSQDSTPAPSTTPAQTPALSVTPAQVPHILFPTPPAPTPAPSPSPDAGQDGNGGTKRGRRSIKAKEKRAAKRLSDNVGDMISATEGAEAASDIEQKYKRRPEEVKLQQPLPVGVLKRH